MAAPEGSCPKDTGLFLWTTIDRYDRQETVCFVRLEIRGRDAPTHDRHHAIPAGNAHCLFLHGDRHPPGDAYLFGGAGHPGGRCGAVGRRPRPADGFRHACQPERIPASGDQFRGSADRPSRSVESRRLHASGRRDDRGRHRGPHRLDPAVGLRAEIAARTPGPDHPAGHQRCREPRAGPDHHQPALWRRRDRPHRAGDRARHRRRANPAGARLLHRHLSPQRGPCRVSGALPSAQVSTPDQVGDRRAAELRRRPGARAMRFHHAHSRRGRSRSLRVRRRAAYPRRFHRSRSAQAAGRRRPPQHDTPVAQPERLRQRRGAAARADGPAHVSRISRPRHHQRGARSDLDAHEHLRAVPGHASSLGAGADQSAQGRRRVGRSAVVGAPAGQERADRRDRAQHRRQDRVSIFRSSGLPGA